MSKQHKSTFILSPRKAAQFPGLAVNKSLRAAHAARVNTAGAGHDYTARDASLIEARKALQQARVTTVEGLAGKDGPGLTVAKEFASSVFPVLLDWYAQERSSYGSAATAQVDRSGALVFTVPSLPSAIAVPPPLPVVTEAAPVAAEETPAGEAAPVEASLAEIGDLLPDEIPAAPEDAEDLVDGVLGEVLVPALAISEEVAEEVKSTTEFVLGGDSGHALPAPTSTTGFTVSFGDPQD